MGMPRYFGSKTNMQLEYIMRFGFAAGAAGALPALSAFTIPGTTRDLDAATTKVAATTGLYDFFFKYPFLALLPGWSFRVIQAAYSAAGACEGYITVDNAATAAAPKVRVTFRTAAGAAVDLASGDVVFAVIPVMLRKQ
jgi:hypothetical protein